VNEFTWHIQDKVPCSMLFQDDLALGWWY